ncbi:hypothetical protein [Sedimentisphaera salicampi]|uniref:hypothetical protein n=1 Tax=Sedimentisphaera salicampi TaxID=1941349 RepID=UPI000B9ACC0B|nr:hypothetical protein [Sedimentisphaera salicampi]OXU14433.1 hypothetical protein SMSP1_01740 [Sedimentisphaera salicampi]
MPIGTIDIRLRPIKLAFLLSPSDKPSLLKAVQINSCLWGGVFNPIIPFYRRTPKIWGDKFTRNVTAKNIVEGYIKAFDPDFIVPIGDIKIDDHRFSEEKIISPDKIISGFKDDGTPRYGIGVFELLKHIYEKEIKFVRKEPLQILFPTISSKFKVFLSSFFGELPKSIDYVVNENFDEFLSIERPPVTIQDYTNNFSSRKLFPRHLTMLEINPLRVHYKRDCQCIFLMDASNSLDIIDYWNLRASGWNVIPIAKQICTLDSVKTLASEFIEDNFIHGRHNPNIFHGTTILKSRSTSETALKDFTASLKIQKPENPKKFKYSMQHWYPRMWDNWAREHDGVGACKLEVKDERYDLQTITDHISLRTIDPDFASRFGGHGTHRFANEVDIRIYGDNGKPYAEVIPHGIECIAHSIGAIGFREWRISNDGLVYLSTHPKWKMTLSPPLAENVMISWLKSEGWEVTVSSPGLIANQMLKQLGGSWGIAILTRLGLIKLLSEMSGGKSLLKNSFWGKIQKISQEDKFTSDPKGLLQRLTELKIFRLGFDIQCPVCQQRSWHNLSEFDYETICPICLNISDIPSHSPDDIKWSYRSFGAFSLPKQAFGVYTVLLTYYFFARTLDGATTPVMSFEAKKNTIAIEADLAIFFQKTKFGKPKRELIFVECKTFNRFEKKDVDRMKIISKEFPGAVIVFATLNPTLTQKEKRLFRPLVKQGRKYWQEGKTNNPVLILTSTELFSHISLDYSYKEKGGEHAKFEGRHFDLHQLRPLCNITQQLYLDMEP